MAEAHGLHFLLLIEKHVDVGYGEVQPLQGHHHGIGARKRKKNEAGLSEKKAQKPHRQERKILIANITLKNRTQTPASVIIK